MNLTGITVEETEIETEIVGETGREIDQENGIEIGIGGTGMTNTNLAGM